MWVGGHGYLSVLVVIKQFHVVIVWTMTCVSNVSNWVSMMTLMCLSS